MTWLPRWLAAVVAFCAIASVHAQTPPAGVPCTALGRAVIANSGQVLLNSHTLVDSYQSNLGPYGGANIGDHGDIQAASNILQNSGAVIHGSTFANTPAGLQPISPPATAQNLGTFLLNGSQSATLAAGDYVASSFTLNSNSKLIIAGGQVRIWVTGALILGGAANQGGIPGNLQFLVTSTQDVHVNSGGSLFGARLWRERNCSCYNLYGPPHASYIEWSCRAS